MRLDFEAPAPANARDLGAWHQSIATSAQAAMIKQDLAMTTGPVLLYASFRMPIPKGKEKKLKGQAHVSRPDVDSLDRTLQEALQDIAYKERSQIFRKEIGKTYHEPEAITPRVYVSVVGL